MLAVNNKNKKNDDDEQFYVCVLSATGNWLTDGKSAGLSFFQQDSYLRTNSVISRIHIRDGKSSETGNSSQDRKLVKCESGV